MYNDTFSRETSPKGDTHGSHLRPQDGQQRTRFRAHHRPQTGRGQAQPRRHRDAEGPRPDTPKATQTIELSLGSVAPYSMDNAGEGVELTGVALFEGQVETLRVTTYPNYHAAIVRKA